MSVFILRRVGACSDGYEALARARKGETSGSNGTVQLPSLVPFKSCSNNFESYKLTFKHLTCTYSSMLFTGFTT